MDFEQKLLQFADQYKAQGYEVIIRPGPEDLPPFARDFHVEILGKRVSHGVLVSVKKNWSALAEDENLGHYAEITGKQEHWRYDLATLEAEPPNIKEIDGAVDFSAEDIEKSFDESLELVRLDFFRPAFITAWAGLEAAMRMRLRAAGEQADWGSLPTDMLRELYSSGMIDNEEWQTLKALFRVRNQIVHGYRSTLALDGAAVQSLCDTGRRLIEESRSEALLAEAAG